MNPSRSPTAFSFSLLLLASLFAAASSAKIKSSPAMIAGDSMAPALKGDHLCVPCADCGFLIECGLEHPPDRGRIVCPNCGSRENPVESARRLPPDSVRVVPLSIAGPVQRYDLIAFSVPESGEMAVKRVIGMPGETVAIERGDVWIDGRRLAKTLDQFEQTSLMVNDSNFWPAVPRPASGWIATGDSTVKIDRDTAFRLRGAVRLRGAANYVHRPISMIDHPADSPRLTSAPILDFDYYNQSLSRPLAAVSDCRLAGEFRGRSENAFTIQLAFAEVGSGRLIINDQTARVQWKSADETIEVQWPLTASRSWHRFSLAMIDGRLLAKIDNVCRAIAIDQSDAFTTSPTFQIQSDAVDLRRLRIDRDIYYLHPHGTQAAWSLGRPLADGEYFVLGDNSTASTDSRHWNQGISHELILGKVIFHRD